MQISNEGVELEELREMKADVERREKAQAAVLERQAKRLDELEHLYKVCPYHVCCMHVPLQQSVHATESTNDASEQNKPSRQEASYRQNSNNCCSGTCLHQYSINFLHHASSRLRSVVCMYYDSTC